MSSVSVPAPGLARARLSQRTAFTMLAVVGVTYAVNAMDRIVFSILLPNVREEFGFSLEQGGFLATVFTLGIGLSGIPTGYLLDRFSRMGVMLIGIAIYSALTILSAFSFGFYDMALYRALSGVGEGMQNAALFTAVGAYFASNRAAALGSMNFAYGIGSFIGPGLAAYILVWTNDWKAPLITYGVLGLVAMAAAWLTVPPDFTEQQAETVNLARPDADGHIPPGVLNRNVVICALSAVTLGVSGYGFLGLYRPVRLSGPGKQHKAVQNSHAELGFRSGLSPPLRTVSGREKSYRPRKLRWRQMSGDRWARSSGRTSMPSALACWMASCM